MIKFLKNCCDATGNLTNVVYPNSPSLQYSYDALNRVTNMVDAAGTTLYGYAAGGQLWTEDGPWASDTVTNSYTSRLRTGLNLAQPTGQWTNLFAYDPAKRLTNVTSQAGAFGYTFVGQASRLTQKLSLPNSSYVTNAYDNVARMRFTKLNNSSHTTLDAADYGYNAGHQRTTFTNAAGTYVQYTNDPIGQLKIANSSENSEDRGYLYDAAWNMSKRTNYLGGTPLTTSYTYNGKNELTKVGFAPYHYDGNGNRIDIREDSPLYEYDDENRLIVIEDSGGWRTEFTYDGTGRLRQRLEYTGEPGDWTLQSETRYIYDGWRVIQERDASNVPTVAYTRGTDLSGSLEGAGGIGGLLARSHGYSGGNWSTHNFYHADGNGNITYLVDSSQTLAASYRYDPFGNTISSSGALAADNVYRFSSKEQHGNSGLYYYGYRFYDANVQRWLNRDPIDIHGGINLYRMVGNAPNMAVDPLGLTVCQEICDFILYDCKGKPSPCCTITWSCGPGTWDGQLRWPFLMCDHVCKVAAITGTCCPPGVGVGSVDGRGKKTTLVFGCRGAFTWKEQIYK